MATITIDGCYIDVVNGLYDSGSYSMTCTMEFDGKITIKAEEADFLAICGVLSSHGIEDRN